MADVQVRARDACNCREGLASVPQECPAPSVLVAILTIIVVIIDACDRAASTSP